jgi:undecaprenyl-diphosphatase
MELLKVISLGIIQGLTEYLPVSSSGHLVIFQHLLGLKNDLLTLDVFLHFGTLIPLIIIFWSDIRDILLLKKEKRHLTILIIIGVIPTAIIGILFEDFFTELFSSISIVGYMLIITGILLFLVEHLGRVNKGINEMKPYNAIIVGLAQGLAIIPGISRSGSTIIASLFQGLDRDSAARYSFLISIPVILGAGLMKLNDVFTEGLSELNISSIITGTIVAAFAGYFAIKYFLHILKKGRLVVFSYYCWIVGILVIIMAGLF